MIGEDFDATLADAQAGDEVAFARLWTDLNPPLVQYLRLFARRNNTQAAEDLAAETWLDVVRGLGRFRGGEPAWRSWVFTIARHRVFDASRRLQRRPEAEAYEVSDVHEQTAPDCADTALEHIATDRILRLVADLPGVQAEVVLLRVVAGLPAEAVGRLVGCSPGAVRANAHRALRRLATRLAREGVTP